MLKSEWGKALATIGVMALLFGVTYLVGRDCCCLFIVFWFGFLIIAVIWNR